MSYYVDNDNNDGGSVHSKWNDRLRNIRISRIYMFRLHHKFVIDRTNKINKIVDGDKTNKSIDKDSHPTYVNNTISNEIPDDRKELVLSALDKINSLSNEKDTSVKRVGIDSDKELPKVSTEKIDIYKSDIGEIPSDREEFVLGVLKDVRKSAPEREVSVKRVGIDSDKEVPKVSTEKIDIHKSDIGEIPNDREEFVLGVLKDVRKSAPEREVSVKMVGIDSDKEIPKVSTEKIDVHKSDIGEIPNDREEFVLGVLKDVRKSAPEREGSVKRVGIDSKDIESDLEKIDSNVLIHLRDDFENQMDELEVLEGELYSRNLDEDSTYVKDEISICKKRVQVLIDKLDKLLANKKNQYDDLSDDTIEDCLYEYRMLLDSTGEYDDFSKEYQKLDEYYVMYDSLKNNKNHVSSLKDKVNIITEKVAVDDSIQNRLLNIDYINKSCVNQMNQQNEYLDNLMKKINDISSSEYVTTHIKGFGELVRASFKYLGLLMLNPLKGTLPGIGVEALAAKELVGNLYQNLHLEKTKHIHYSTVNYQNELNSKIRDVEYVDNLLGDSLRDISKLKSDFKLKFDSSFPSFDSTLDKINKIEHTIVRNQNKVNKIKKRMENSKKINEEKLMRIKKLNEH